MIRVDVAPTNAFLTAYRVHERGTTPRALLGMIRYDRPARCWLPAAVDMDGTEHRLPPADLLSGAATAIAAWHDAQRPRLAGAPR